MENSRKNKNCKNVVHRASYAKHLFSKRQLQSIKQEKTVIPGW